MRSEQEVNRAIDQYSDTIRRLCMIYLKNYADTEDIFQTVFLKYTLNDTAFKTSEHEKAWLIKVTINACKDMLKNFFRRNRISIEEVIEQAAVSHNGSFEVLEAVLTLPQKYRNVIYLHYIEGYTAREIADILKKNVNTVYTLLTRSKRILKEKLGGDEDE